MPGDERYLGKELVAAVAGRKPATIAWTRGDGRVSMVTGLGSCNLPLLRWAVRLWREPEGRFGDAVEVWLAIFAFLRTAWMSSEFGSRIYGTWHLGSVLAVYAWARKHGQRALEDAAGGWLLYWWCLCRLIEAPDGRILMVGMRSAGHAPHAGMLEWLFAAATGGDTRRWEAEARRHRLGLRQKWEYQLAKSLGSSLVCSAAPLLGRVADAEVVMPRYGLRVGLHILRTSEGLAAWVEDQDPDDDDNVNANTAPVMGSVWRAGQLDWLPPNGGDRVRRKERAVCQREGDRLVYAGSHHGQHSLQLPGGQLLQDVTLPLGKEAA